MNNQTILIVDDDPDFMESTRDLLESQGFSIRSADNGEEGLEAAIASPPDLMILDVMMAHDSEGFDISRRVREQPGLEKLPILMVTGIRRELNLPYGFEPDNDWLPVNELLEKPVAPARLLEEIQKLLKG